MWVREMAQRVKVLVGNLDDLKFNICGSHGY